ncbi:MAG: 2-oxo acid dehydrogenase subunit E2 [Candidatus Omnitrophica bacterium]|nr:2-oxo acid dehydrogenase subunit E2 [Candidatus Omnitrophota bacterium]
MIQIKIPFLAEGVDSGTVVSILISEGAAVKKDQTILELETNKATAPIPSPYAGTVAKILVKEGEEVRVGQAVVTLAGSGATPSAPPAEEKQLPTAGLPPPASPSVRKMARDLGIDLTKIRGSERGGRITIEDLKAYVQGLRQARSETKAQKSAVSIDFSKWGPVSRKPLSSIRRIIGQKMQESWTTIPHVTQFAEADITSLLELRKIHTAEYERGGARLTVTAMILKAVIRVLKKYPVFNSSLDESKNEIVYKNYYHFGIAVDTEQGLLVPVLKNVDQKNLLELSIELAELSEKARQKKVTLEEVQGGTFTISNLGSIGGSHFAPIINKPEVAILGVGQGVLKPVVKNGKITTATILPIALSYDHRVIDGADGARFVQELVEALEHFEESDLKI